MRPQQKSMGRCDTPMVIGGYIHSLLVVQAFVKRSQ
jgi:hypothetical protein